MKIKVRRSPVQDASECDWTKVTEDQLLKASYQHIDDVYRGIEALCDELMFAASEHDYTKITRLSAFHKDLTGNFESKAWLNEHIRDERHHLSTPEGVPEDVDLLDVLEQVVDCVMAYRGRSTSREYQPLQLSAELLQKALDNTEKLMLAVTETVEEGSVDDD